MQKFKPYFTPEGILANNMQPLLLTLLIGTAFAMVNAAPAQNELQSLQAILEGNDDRARMAKWLNIAKRVVAGAHHALNGEYRDLAEQQEEDSNFDEEVDDLVDELAKSIRQKVAEVVDNIVDLVKDGGKEDEEEEENGDMDNGEEDEGDNDDQDEEDTDNEDEEDEAEELDKIMSCIRARVETMLEEGEKSDDFDVVGDLIQCIESMTDDDQDEDGEAKAQFLPLLIGTGLSLLSKG